MEQNAMTHDQYKGLQNHFQFLILLMVFFPTITTALFEISSTSIDANQQYLKWGVVIAVWVLNYVLLEIFQTKLAAWVGKLINFLVLINVACFIPVLYILAMNGNTLPTLTLKISFLTFYYPLMFVSLLVMVILGVNTVLIVGWFLGSKFSKRTK